MQVLIIIYALFTGETAFMMVDVAPEGNLTAVEACQMAKENVEVSVLSAPDVDPATVQIECYNKEDVVLKVIMEDASETA